MNNAIPDEMTDLPASLPLMSPVEALHRGFQFDGGGAPDTALAAAYKASSGPAGQGAGAEVLVREGFRIGHLGLMIRYEDGSELADMPAIYRLPNAPDWLLGVANLHGLLVPVFDLATHMGLEHQADAKPMLLVLGHGPDAAGVLVDGLPVRLRVKATDQAEGAPVPATLEGCVTQTYWASERTWMDLQVGLLLDRLHDELAATSQ